MTEITETMSIDEVFKAYRAVTAVEDARSRAQADAERRGKGGEPRRLYKPKAKS